MLIDPKYIKKAKEKLGDQTAFIIAEELQLEDFDEKNLKGRCCFHQEDTPSMIFNPKTLSYHCFGCGRNTDILDAYMHNGCTYLQAVQKLFDLTGIKHPFGELGVKTKASYRYPKEVVCTDKTKVYEYLALRKISKETIDRTDVRQDEHGNIVFNFYDLNDTLCVVKYRPSHKIVKGKEAKCWCQKDADVSQILFNMNRINTDSPLLICEGEIDCLSAIEAGDTNTVSVPLGANNYGWIEECWDFLEQFDSIIICADNDEAGLKMKKEAVYRLGSWRTKVVEIPDLEFAGRKVKDINEVLYVGGKQAVIDMILNAKDTPLDGVIDYADIESIDIDQIDGIKTGIKELDKKLMKLFEGTLNIITGVNGSGKSSFLSSIICETLDQGKNVFMYSGELPNYLAKSWIDYIFAGQRNVKQYQSGDTTYWKVPSDVRNEIGNYYRDKLFIYKDGYTHKASEIIKTAIDAIRKSSAKLIVIDNLTSINLECNENNKYNKQEEFVTQLIDMAKKFNVTVCLVIHPHKIETMRRLTKMDIQGVSALCDLAHRIISLYRVTEYDKKGEMKRNGSGYLREPIKADVIVDCLKDRLLGHEGASVPLYYDKPSRRFFTDEEHLDKRFDWDKKQYNTPLPYPPEQLIDNSEEVFGKVGGRNA